MPGFAKAYGFDMKIFEFRLQKEWGHIVGASLASHTRPDSIKFRKLTLLAENSAWLQQLVFLKPMLLEKINAYTESVHITDIILRIGAIQSTKTSETAGTDSQNTGRYSIRPSASTLELAGNWTAQIKDPDLRKSIIQVVAKGLSLTQQISGGQRENRG